MIKVGRSSINESIGDSNMIYHATYLDSAIQILRSNTLKLGSSYDSKGQICFTSDPKYSVGREETPIKLVLNLDKLSSQYTLTKFSGLKEVGDSESEFRSASQINNLSRYLVSIDLSGNLTADKLFARIKKEMDNLPPEYYDIDYWREFFSFTKSYKLSKELAKLKSLLDRLD